MTILRWTLCFFIALIFSPFAHSAMPAHVIPGALEEEVRAALPLVNCRTIRASSKDVICDSKATQLVGIPGRYSVTFAFGRLMFMSFFIERKHFDTASLAVSELLGAPTRTEDYEVPIGFNGKKAPHKVFVWGNTDILASVTLYAPGKDGLAQILFLHPLAVPSEVRATYLPPTSPVPSTLNVP
jgi:hypothetical protein